VNSVADNVDRKAVLEGQKRLGHSASAKGIAYLMSPPLTQNFLVADFNSLLPKASQGTLIEQVFESTVITH